MASLIQWTWVWANSRSWWWTGKPGVLQTMGSQRVGTWLSDQTEATENGVQLLFLKSSCNHIYLTDSLSQTCNNHYLKQLLQPRSYQKAKTYTTMTLLPVYWPPLMLISLFPAISRNYESVSLAWWLGLVPNPRSTIPKLKKKNVNWGEAEETKRPKYFWLHLPKKEQKKKGGSFSIIWET